LWNEYSLLPVSDLTPLKPCESEQESIDPKLLTLPMHRLILVILLFLSANCFAQTERTFRITSSYTSFPDSVRAKGHTYDKVFYSADEHYSDSSVLIIIPPKLKAKKTVDLVFWFHGWRNTIDSSANYFELIKQFIASNRNAVLVIPETAKNSPDSYGGKLEKKDVFKNLVQDVINKLKKEKAIAKRAEAGNIILAGHSGAFRIMAYILQNGGVEVKQIILFDGLYSQVDKYTSWIQADPSHRFLHIYTNKGGGTDAVSAEMMKGLHEKNIAFINPEEKDVDAPLLRSNQVIFIHSLKEHNDVINRPDHNFRLYLENSVLMSIL
jgi:predicted esterase